jgi:glucosyl-3-phosphoglycerate synthase
MAEGLVKLAASLAGASLEGVRRHIRIVVLGIVTVPDDTPLSQGAPLVRAYRTMLRYIPQNGALEENVEVHTEVRVAREVWRGIADQVKEEEGDLLLLHWKGSTQTPGKIYGDTLDALMDDPPCDVVLARFSNSLPPIKQILLPVRGGSYSTLALSLVSNLAEEWSAGITVMHNLGNNSGLADNFRPSQTQSYSHFSDGYEVEDESLSTLQALALELPPNAKLVAMQGKLIQSIVQEAQHHDLIVVGASESRESMAEQSSGEKIAERIARETRRPLLVVKTAKPFELKRPSPGLAPAPVFKEPDLQESVDRWFAENTFRYREFRTMSSLTLLKERHHLRISLVLPVYGKTHPVALSDYVRRAWFALIRDCALVDEILISDPDNRLDRAEVEALYQGGPGHGRLSDNEIVYIASEDAQPGRGEDLGPGEALWLALKHARGDLIVWADPTMDNFEARLIYGLVGPLLTYPEFQLAGGFYSESGEGGEQNSNPVHNALVELSLRPLLGGFFPKLAGVINPVCTVGAARRELLERVPLFSGPAFMTGLLIDTVVRNDLMSVTQVDLGPKPDSNITIAPQLITADALSILLRRAEERSQNSLWSNFNPAIKTVQKSGEVYSLKVEQPTSVLKEFPPVDFTAGYVRHYFESELEPETE